VDPLSAKARLHLRGLGHPLKPVVLVGKEGISEALVASVKGALTTHELIKVKLGENATTEDHDRKAVAAELAAASGGEMVGLLGRTLLLFKRNTKKPKILLPGEKAPKVKPPPGKAKANRAKRADRKAKATAKTPREGRSTRARARVSRELEGKPVADPADGDFSDDET
jgi:RNA-binding protein